MTFIEKVSIKDLYRFIVKFNGQYNTVPGAGFMAGYFKVTPQTIHRKLDTLEAEGKIKQIKKVKNIIRYELVG